MVTHQLARVLLSARDTRAHIHTACVILLCLCGPICGRAFGQATVPDGFVDELVVGGLDEPVGMAWLPDGRLLIIERRTGAVRLVVGESLVADPIGSVPNLSTDGERGLLGIAVDPAFPVRPYVYLYHTQAGTPATIHVTMYSLTGDLADPQSTFVEIDPASRFEILTDIPDNQPNHNGGTLRFLRAGTEGSKVVLLISSGDDVASCQAQNPASPLGAILRLDVSALPQLGSGPPDKGLLVPADNPLALDPDDNARLVAAYGLRNPFRFAIDPVTGRAFIGDVGNAQFEEINLMTPPFGQNYGWPFREGPGAGPGGCAGNPVEPLSEPIASYDRMGFTQPLASVVSAVLYRGVNFPFDASFPPEYDGDHFFGDFFEGFLRRLKESADGTWHVAPRVSGQPTGNDWATGLAFASDFSVGPSDGAVYYVRQSGSLRRIRFAPELVSDTIIAPTSATGEPGEPDLPVRVTTSNPIVVGSTDLRLHFDPAVVEVANVTSSLEHFVHRVDEGAGTITTASASAAGQAFGADDTLFSVSFDIRPDAPAGCVDLSIEDADATPPDDLVGPIPPIEPLPQIVYAAGSGQICVSTCGNGHIDGPEVCDDGNNVDGDCCSSRCDQNAAEGTACDDGLFCTGLDTCRAGRCVHSGDPCTEGNECADTCNEAVDDCFDPAGTACADDGLFCTGVERCNGAGACVGTGDPCPGTACNRCQEASDSCADPVGTPCIDDGLFCTGVEQCNGAGACVGTGDPCPGTACNRCQETSDSCVDPVGTLCDDDGRFCTGVEQCNGAGACVGTGDPCPSTVCNRCQETSDSCVDPVGTLCDDGEVCTTQDVCQDGHCAGSPRPCASLGDVDCDEVESTPIDAQVILCLDARRCEDGDVPAPCDEPRVRTARSDWDLDGDVDGADAATTVAVFVGITDPATTQLGACCLDLAPAEPGAPGN